MQSYSICRSQERSATERTLAPSQDIAAVGRQRILIVDDDPLVLVEIETSSKQERLSKPFDQLALAIAIAAFNLTR